MFSLFGHVLYLIVSLLFVLYGPMWTKVVAIIIFIIYVAPAFFDGFGPTSGNYSEKDVPDEIDR